MELSAIDYRQLFRVLFLSGMFYMGLGIAYRMSHLNGEWLPLHDWNWILFGAFFANTVTVVYWVLLAFSIVPERVQPQVSFWIALMTFLELVALGTYLHNGAFNRLIQRLLQWTRFY